MRIETYISSIYVVCFRIPSVAYSKIYKVPSDDVSSATKYKEAPIIDNAKVLTDRETLRERENQSTHISIPEEVR